MHLYEVGKPFASSIPYADGEASYTWDGAGHYLHCFLSSPGAKETTDYRKGRAEFALLSRQGVVFLLYRFGGRPWGDAPYSIHLQREITGKPVPIPPAFDSPAEAELRQLLNFTLIDAATGLIHVLRATTFSAAFTRALHAAIREQDRLSWIGETDYRTRLEDLYRRYPTTGSMLRGVTARCTGGES